MHANVIIYVAFIEILAIMSPGPDFFMVLKNTLTDSLEAGFYTTLGITLGSSIIFTLGVLGIGAIVIKFKLLFMLIKILGALYLVYLALKAFFSKTKIKEPALSKNGELKPKLDQYFKVGLICNLTNPKAFMFIISLSTYIAIHGNPYIDGLIVILISGCATLLWFTIVSFIFGRVSIRRIFYKKQRLINIIFGIVLIFVATKIIIL